MRSERPFSAAKSTFVIFMTLLLASAMSPTHAQAQKFKVLHTFHGADGAFPITQLTRDAAGNLYGTTSEGGAGVCTFGSSKVSCGTAFKLDKTGCSACFRPGVGDDFTGPVGRHLELFRLNLQRIAAEHGARGPNCLMGHVISEFAHS